MSTSGNKNLIFALAAGAVVVGGALLFHYLSGATSESDAVMSQLLTEIDALGKPKKEINGLLAFSYYKDVFGLIQKHAKAKFAREKQELLAQRRGLLRAGKTAEYKEIVKEMIKKEEEMCGDLLAEAMSHIGLNEQEFMQMHQHYMTNP
jgi:superfamily I DNA and/or RNA helicase